MFQGALLGIESIRIQQLPQSKRLQWDYTAQNLVSGMKELSLWAHTSSPPWGYFERHKIILFPLHLHSLVLFIIYLMHTFLLSIAVCAKLKDFTGSQSSVFNYHHQSYIWLRP